MSQVSEFEALSHQRNQFFRNQYRKLLKLLLILIIICATLSAVLSFLLWSAKPAKYYASTNTGNVVALSPLSSPVVTQDYVLQWAELVARSAYTLDFGTYESQLQKTSQYFTPEGWQAFNEALKTSSLLDTVINEKLAVSVVVNGPAVMINRYIRHGRFTWEIQMPLLMSYTSANMTKKKQIYVSMTVTRVPELEEARGIAVTNFYNG